ncbi:Glyoxal reductase (GR) (Methylglyoxal reductase) [Durusdinium trenchii]|uniref:Glyoxal reductase (GR) (Methylglyoxal reductase) n=1 Tax=Durusdinium trenchii TaxID=1381693 RepID=A0ABP0L1Y9_9DINO
MYQPRWRLDTGFLILPRHTSGATTKMRWRSSAAHASTSKIHPEDLGYTSTLSAFKVSLQRLKTDYLDVMLLHKPWCWPGACSRQPEGTWKDGWRALEELHGLGQALAIGICDVDMDLLEELLQQRQKPHIIQNWMDPFHQDKLVRRKCQEEGIQYQAYSTLGAQWVYFKGYEVNPVFSNLVLQEIAQFHNRTVAQVVLNWAVHRGISIIPASKDPTRQRSNFHSFDFTLAQEQMDAIDALDGALDKKGPEL